MNKKIDFSSSPNKRRRESTHTQQTIFSFKSTQDLFEPRSRSNMFDDEDKKKKLYNPQTELDIISQKTDEVIQNENPIDLKPKPQVSSSSRNETLKNTVEEEDHKDPELLQLEQQLQNPQVSKSQYITFVINVLFMTTLLLEYRIPDLSDAASAIDSIFLQRPLDVDSIYYLDDTSTMKDPQTIYSVFLSDALLYLLFTKDITAGDLFTLPSNFDIPNFSATNQNLNYIKFNNVLLGAAVTITNTSITLENSNAMNNIYGHLLSFQLPPPDVTAVESLTVENELELDPNLNLEAINIQYPIESFIKQYDAEKLVLLLPGEVNFTVAQYMMAHLKPYLIYSPQFVNQISLSVYFFNPISEICLQAMFTFTKTLQGTLSFEHYFTGGFPLMYSTHQFTSSTVNFYFVMKILMMIWAIFLFMYKFLMTLFTMIERYMHGSPLEFDLGILVVLGNHFFIIFGISFFLSFYNVYLKNPLNFPFSPMVIFHDLEFLNLFFRDAQTMWYLTMFMIFVTLLQLIIFFNGMFPSFGLHFLTLEKARYDLLIIMSFILILFIGFATWGYVLFGSSNPDFSSFFQNILYLLHYMISFNYLENLGNASVLMWIFYICFYFCFNLVFLFFFIAIIISNFHQLKNKINLTATAISRIIAKESKETSQKWLNLLCMKPPVDDYEEIKGDEKPSHSEKYFKEKEARKRFTGVEIILYNLDRLHINPTKLWDIFRVDQIKTVSERQKAIVEEIEKVYAEQTAEKERLLNWRKKELFSIVKKALTRALFVILYLITLELQIPAGPNVEIKSQILSYYNKTFCSLYNITRPSLDFCFDATNPSPSLFYSDIDTMMDVRDWLFGVYLPLIESPLINNTSADQNFHNFSNGGFNLVGHYGSRVTFRYFTPIADIIEQSPPFLPFIYYRRAFGMMDPTNGPFPGEYSLTMFDYIAEDPVKPDWIYNEPGTDRTSYSAGGYVIYFEKESETENNKILKNWILTNSTFNVLLGMVNFDTIFYSSYYDCYVYCKHLFLAQPSGNVISKIVPNIFYYDIANRPNFVGQVILELILLYLYIKFWANIIQTWMVEWNFYRDLTPYHEKFKKKKIYYFFDIDFKHHDIISMGDLGWLVLIRLYNLTKRFLLSVQRYLFNSILNLLEFITQIMIFVCEIYWMSINNIPDPTQYQISKIVNSTDQSLFQKMEGQALNFQLYRQVQGFIIVGLIFQTLKYFYFSKRMSKLLEIFNNAKYDYLFYVFMFSIALIAFSILAFFTFGVILDDYNNFSNSVVRCLLMLLGNINLDDMMAADPIIGPLFYISFNILMNLILLQMFIAILDGHYIDYEKANSGQNKLDFFPWLLVVFREECERENEYLNQWKLKELPKNKFFLSVFFNRISEYYTYYEYWVTLRIMLIFLGGKIDKTNKQIVFSKDIHEENIISMKDLGKAKNNNKIKLDFEFKIHEKRKLEEYDDLQIYLSKNKNYLITDNNKNEKIIDEIDFGIINVEKLKIDQQTSSNVWISMLDKNLTHVTSRKFDLAYFEHQNYSFWMNLNQKFFFKTEEFIEFQGEKFTLLDRDVLKALEEIVMSCHKDLNKKRDGSYLEEILKRINFAFFYFLNYYVAKKQPPEMGRTPADTTYKKKLTRMPITFTNLPILKPTTMTNIDYEKENGIINLDEKIRETEYIIPKIHRKDKLRYHIIKLQYQRINIAMKSDEQLMEMDDNDIIEKLTNFTGVMNFWSSLNFNERFQIWVGTNPKAKFMPYHKSVIWNILNFKTFHFKKTGIEENHILKRILCAGEEISMELFEFIWKFCYLENDEDLITKKIPNSYEELSKYRNKKLSKYHLYIVESLVRKSKKLENISSIKNISKRFEILQGEYKTSMKKDEKLFWWLLSDVSDKINLILANPSKIMADFLILLIIEEYYNNILLLTKLEKIVNNTLNHQIYTHYTMFARVQSFLTALEIKTKKISSDEDSDTLEYIKYLESQMIKTDKLLSEKLSEVKEMSENIKRMKGEIYKEPKMSAIGQYLSTEKLVLDLENEKTLESE